MENHDENTENKAGGEDKICPNLKQSFHPQFSFPLDETADPEISFNLVEKDARSGASSGESSRRSSSDEEVEFMTRDLPACGPHGVVGLDMPGISVESVVVDGGHTMCVGDVVWGKTAANPWWPGKVSGV